MFNIFDKDVINILIKINDIQDKINNCKEIIKELKNN